MITSRPGLAGLLILLTVIAAGCAGAEEEDDGTADRADVAVPSYRPARGVPDFCGTLAATGRLTDIASAVGTLTGRPGDSGATARLAGAVDDLDAVREAVQEDGGHPRLETGLDDLVDELVRVVDGAPAGPARPSISAALDEVGRLAQPVCGFPA